MPVVRRSLMQRAALPLLLALLAGACLWPVARYGFINFDDPLYVAENPMLRQGLSPRGISWAFTTTRSGNWHPLTWISLLADTALFNGDPRGYHLVNLALHLACVVILFLVLRGMTGAPWPSFLAAALFGIHPLRVESVAWIAERKDVLAALGGLGTLAAWLFFLRRPGRLRYFLALLPLLLGLLAKPMLVTIPLILLLLDFWPLGRWRPGLPGGRGSRLVLEKVPFLLLAMLSGVVTLLVQAGEGNFGGAFKAANLANAAVSYGRYLGKSFWPAGLAVFYPLPAAPYPAWQVLGALLLLAGATALAARQLRRRPFLAVGWLWFLIALLPVIGLVQVGSQAMADRYTYLPSVGLAIIIGWAADQLRSRGKAARLLVGGAAAAILAGLLIVTAVQVHYWRGSEALFRHALEVTTGNYLAHNQLGRALDAQGKAEEAMQQYEEALRLKLYYEPALLNLGNHASQAGDLSRALDFFERARRRNPRSVEALNNLGATLNRLGRSGEAIPYFAAAIALQPDVPYLHNNLGAGYYRLGKLDEAAAQFQEALRLDPKYAEARQNLGLVEALRRR